MKENAIDLILKSVLSQRDETLTHKQTIAVREAIAQYAILAIDRYRSNETKAVALEAVKFFPSLFRMELKLWLRKVSFVRAKKLAINRAEIENRKMYVIRNTDIKYVVISTGEVGSLKKMIKYKGAMDFLTLSKISDYIAYPNK